MNSAAEKKIKKKIARPAAVERLRESIRRLRLDRWGGSVHVHESSLFAYEQAKELDCRLLEAEALLQLGRSFAPMIYPAEAFKYLDQAERVFLANDQPVRAAECRVVAARALFDMGQDRDAIAYAYSAIRMGSLSAEYQAAAFVVAAMTHAHLGELDEGLQLLDARALPLSEAPGAQMVRPHALRAAAALRVQLLIVGKAPELWRGLPGVPSIDADSPKAQEILAFLDAARKAMPNGKAWGIIELLQLLVEGLSGSSKHPLLTLGSWVDIARTTDPPTACWALFCRALILQLRGSLNEALKSLQEALSLARRWGLTMAVGDILLQKARIREALGHHALSLRSYKEYWGLRFLSMRATAITNEFAANLDAASSHESTVPVSALRSTEPESVVLAAKYVVQNLSRKLVVSEVAEYCGVSRRTLEVAFKTARATTVAQYIRRKRLEQAAEALRATNCTVHEIASSVGYATSAAFSRDFLLHFGTKPSIWRRQSSIADSMDSDTVDR